MQRETKHYNLQMIIAVGFKVNNERAVQFRKWANSIVKDYTIKGWVSTVLSIAHISVILWGYDLNLYSCRDSMFIVQTKNAIEHFKQCK